MQLDEYTRLDATALRELIARGEISAAEVETVAREAIARANAVVNGLSQPVFERALAHAADGPFGGVPFLLKDGPMAEGIEFSLGSRCLDGVRAEHDSDLMGRFRAAGLAALGVTTMPELGLSFVTEPVRYGPRRCRGGRGGGAVAQCAAQAGS